MVACHWCTGSLLWRGTGDMALAGDGVALHGPLDPSGGVAQVH